MSWTLSPRLFSKWVAWKKRHWTPNGNQKREGREGFWGPSTSITKISREQLNVVQLHYLYHILLQWEGQTRVQCSRKMLGVHTFSCTNTSSPSWFYLAPTVGASVDRTKTIRHDMLHRKEHQLSVSIQTIHGDSKAWGTHFVVVGDNVAWQEINYLILYTIIIL